MFQVAVRSRIIGSTQPDTTLPNIVFDLLHEQLTVAELISRTVEEQIRDLLITRGIDKESTRQMLDRQYLSSEDIQRQASQGKISVPSKAVEMPEIDTQVEISRALDAFKRKTYIIVVDGRQVESLEDVLTLSATSKINFMRLTPLVGG